MKTVLHLLTQENDSLSAEIIRFQKAAPDLQVDIFPLNTATPDYDDLLQKIFAADSIQVW